MAEAAAGGVLLEKVLSEISQNSQEKACARDSFYNKIAGLRPATLLKKESLAQAFSCKFWEISKYTFFTEHLPATASCMKVTKKRHNF